MSILCFFGSHRAKTVHQFSFLDSASIFRCEDCGGLIATDHPFHEGQRLRGKKMSRETLKAMPQNWMEQLRAAKLVGLHPPAPWPQTPRGGFHGGPLPEGVDPETEEGREVLQGMLPKAAAPQPTAAEQARVNVHETLRMLGELQREMLEADQIHQCRRDLKDQVWSHVARTTALLGTCCRLKVGCVLISKEGRVVGTGYNGAGPGMPHCETDHCNETCRCGRTLHAEQNALFNRSGEPHTAYITHESCLNCTKELAVSGVRRVVYQKPYTSIGEQERKDRQEWIDFYGIEWEQLGAVEVPE